MGRRIGIKAFLISVLSLAIIFVLCLIFSESDKRQNEIKEETIEEEYHPIDLEKFDVDDDGGYWVIEAILVPKEWK